VKGHPYEQGFDLRLVPEKLTEPFTWRSPKLVFVNSMSDLFQAGVPASYAEAVSHVMASANWHTYQVLTKRAERLHDLLCGRLEFAAMQKHIWWGVSVEDRKYGVPRIEYLRNSPATVRFLSVEPLLEDLGAINLSGISWVIVGGESGPGARHSRKNGSSRSETSAGPQASRSFSNNGAASENRETDVSLMAALTMSIPLGHKRKFRKGPHAWNLRRRFLRQCGRAWAFLIWS
jgi:protein gp37